VLLNLAFVIYFITVYRKQWVAIETVHKT